jgi:cathepsin L
MESSIAVQTGRKGIDLSEQHLVSCGKYGTCGGGYYAFGHFEKYGVVYEEDFKYQARNVSCNRSAPTREKAVDWGYAGGRRGNPSIDDIKRAIVKYGPVAATVAVAGAWQNYGGGLYDNCVYSGTNHIVAIVGWDQKEGEDVWIVKNSFGTRWGDQGYMYSKMTDSRGRKCNNLGESAAYVVYKGEQSTPLAQ